MKVSFEHEGFTYQCNYSPNEDLELFRCKKGLEDGDFDECPIRSNAISFEKYLESQGLLKSSHFVRTDLDSHQEVDIDLDFMDVYEDFEDEFIDYLKEHIIK